MRFAIDRWANPKTGKPVQSREPRFLERSRRRALKELRAWRPYSLDDPELIRVPTSRGAGAQKGDLWVSRGRRSPSAGRSAPGCVGPTTPTLIDPELLRSIRPKRARASARVSTDEGRRPPLHTPPARWPFFPFSSSLTNVIARTSGRG
jgi:hypothetical protein